MQYAQIDLLRVTSSIADCYLTMVNVAGMLKFLIVNILETTPERKQEFFAKNQRS